MILKTSSSLFQEHHYPAMGGKFTYKVYPQTYLNRESVERIVIKAHQEVQRIELKFTEFKQSIITDINQSAGLESVSIDHETLYLLEKSLAYSKISEGAFDISFASYGKKWRESICSGNTISDIEKKRLFSLIDYRKIEIDYRNMQVFLPSKKMKISFGGIGKGYAVDRAFKVMEENGLVNFYINGSGDTRVHSLANAPRPWKIGLCNPFSKDPNKYAGLIQLKNGSASTSGSYVQNNPHSNKSTDHHIVSNYSEPNKNIPLSATVIGEECMDTDVWGTIAMSLNTQESIKLANQNHIKMILIDDSGKVSLSHLATNSFGK